VITYGGSRLDLLEHYMIAACLRHKSTDRKNTAVFGFTKDNVYVDDLDNYWANKVPAPDNEL
jgi:hypothetical protein